MWHYDDMFFSKRVPKRLYADYAAATPLLPEVKAVMRATEDLYGNPSAIHSEGKRASDVVEEARLSLARILGIRVSEVLFTGSGTEANNLAILGYIKAVQAGRSATVPLEVISTPIEHPSVEKVLQILEADGVVVHRVTVNEEGLIHAEDVVALLNKHTALVTFAYANSEVGVVQPVAKIARLVRKYNTAHGTEIKLHIDAAQAPLWLPCQLHSLGVDMLTLDAGKCNGPKGVGVLAKLSSVSLTPITYGGGQEGGVRPATENVVAIAGAAVAIQRAQEGRVRRCEQAEKLSTILRTTFESLPDVVCNGPEVGPMRLPNNVHISLPGFDTEYAVVYLDVHGIAVSTKSACSGAGGGRSEVVWQMTHDAARAASTIRFTLDPSTPTKDLSRVAETLEDFMALQRSVSGKTVES